MGTLKKRLYQRGTLILVFLILLLIYIQPVMAKEKVTVLGEKMRYLAPEEQIYITGNAQIATTDLVIRADQIVADYKDGKVLEIHATGNVRMEKDGESFQGKDLTYHLEDKTGLILDMWGKSKIEESEEPAYFNGEKAYYTEDMIEIVNGSMTTCDLDHPHYLFRAKRIEVYPEDKIRAYHLTFWEFNGKVPLFYWYRYTISLKDEEQQFTPKVGYNAVQGWFLKMTYSYFTDGEQHGELYLDLFQKVGPAAGFTWWYMDHEDNVGSVYLYMQKQTETKTYPYLTFQHLQKYKWDDLKLNTSTTLKRYGVRDTISNSSSLNLRGEGINYLRWNASYSGSLYYQTLTESHSITNTFNGKWKLSDITLNGKYDDRLTYRTGDEEWKRKWTGHLQASQSKSFYQWNLLTEKDSKSSTTDWMVYTLPELSTKLKFSGIKGKLRPYLSPLSYEMKLGHFYEEYSQRVRVGYTYEDQLLQTEAYRWYNQLSFRKQFTLIDPLLLVLGTSGTARLYSTKDVVYEYNPSVELKTRSIHGFSTSVKYNYHKAAEGMSPFRFDKLSARETKKVTGTMAYNKYGINFNSNASYDLLNNKFGVWNNTLTYYWGEKKKSNIRFIVPYRIEDQMFSTMTGTVKLNYENLTFGFGTSLNPNGWTFGKVDSELSWQINENWHINFSTSYYPEKEFGSVSTDKGKLEIIRDLHCREISMSYDAINKEVWFQYHIKAFPKQKFKFGSSDDDPMLFDADLGGILDGTE